MILTDGELTYLKDMLNKIQVMLADLQNLLDEMKKI
jgi:hypothetical protein